MNHLSKWGFGLTAIYLIMLVWLTSNRCGQLLTMPLNELGDFLAGAFGPLAIFWLIVGFFQQGKELQQSTEALQLQAKELNNSVQQQKELVEAQREQTLNYEKVASPVLAVRSSKVDGFKPKVNVRVDLFNYGDLASDLSVSVSSGLICDSNIQTSVWGKDEVRILIFKCDNQTGSYKFKVSYRNRLMQEGKALFVIKLEQGRPPKVEVQKQ